MEYWMEYWVEYWMEIENDVFVLFEILETTETHKKHSFVSKKGVKISHPNRRMHVDDMHLAKWVVDF